MTRLVLKIFLAYWLAAGVVIVIADLEPHRHIHTPELMDALSSSLALNGRIAADAYENHQCSQIQQAADPARESLFLASTDGSFLCGNPPTDDAVSLVQSAAKTSKRATSSHLYYQMIAVPVVSRMGHHFIVLIKSSYSSTLLINGYLPGYTTIIISGVVTVLLAGLIALPIRRLRKAAQKIAAGDLDVRVNWGKLSARIYGLQSGDDIDRLVREFNHMAERLQSLADAQRLLLRDVSHELRSPLARLKVGLGLARMDAPQCIGAHLDRIEVESNRLNELIGQIISLSSIGTVDSLHMKSELDLSEIVRDLIPDAEYEAAQNNCAIVSSIIPRCHIYGDAELLRVAINNILRNAIRYVPTGGSIALEIVDMEKDEVEYAVVRISDNGPGIPEHELADVLKPFYRADRSRHWRQEGFGIGLAIANRAANIHRGMIELRNRESGGLIVELSLPAKEATA